jgi:hypothetical protein
MDTTTLEEAKSVSKPKPALRTKSQKLRKDILDGKVKYLHVSVQVQAPDPIKRIPAMRTPIGQGATAVKGPQPNLGPIGRRRRANQRLMRAAREELARAAV